MYKGRDRSNSKLLSAEEKSLLFYDTTPPTSSHEKKNEDVKKRKRSDVPDFKQDREFTKYKRMLKKFSEGKNHEIRFHSCWESHKIERELITTMFKNYIKISKLFLKVKKEAKTNEGENVEMKEKINFWKKKYYNVVKIKTPIDKKRKKKGEDDENVENVEEVQKEEEEFSTIQKKLRESEKKVKEGEKIFNELKDKFRRSENEKRKLKHLIKKERKKFKKRDETKKPTKKGNQESKDPNVHYITKNKIEYNTVQLTGSHNVQVGMGNFGKNFTKNIGKVHRVSRRNVFTQTQFSRKLNIRSSTEGEKGKGGGEVEILKRKIQKLKRTIANLKKSPRNTSLITNSRELKPIKLSNKNSTTSFTQYVRSPKKYTGKTKLITPISPHNMMKKQHSYKKQSSIGKLKKALSVKKLKKLPSTKKFGDVNDSEDIFFSYDEYLK